jgi:hypothetical protein
MKNVKIPITNYSIIESNYPIIENPVMPILCRGSSL